MNNNGDRIITGNLMPPDGEQKKYEEILNIMPKKVVEFLIMPLSKQYPEVHHHIASFILTLYEKGYCIKKGDE